MRRFAFCLLLLASCVGPLVHVGTPNKRGHGVVLDNGQILTVSHVVSREWGATSDDFAEFIWVKLRDEDEAYRRARIVKIVLGNPEALIYLELDGGLPLFTRKLGSRPARNGDSGTPLIVGGEVVGVFSGVQTAEGRRLIATPIPKSIKLVEEPQSKTTNRSSSSVEAGKKSPSAEKP
jgi:hypothetical protein